MSVGNISTKVNPMTNHDFSSKVENLKDCPINFATEFKARWLCEGPLSLKQSYYCKIFIENMCQTVKRFGS